MKHQRSILKNPFVIYLSGYQNALVSHIDIFWLFLSQRIFKKWNIASSMRTKINLLATFSEQRRRNPSEKLDLLCLHNLVHLQIWIVIRHEKRPKISVNQFLWGELSTLFKCFFLHNTNHRCTCLFGFCGQTWFFLSMSAFLHNIMDNNMWIIHNLNICPCYPKFPHFLSKLSAN